MVRELHLHKKLKISFLGLQKRRKGVSRGNGAWHCRSTEWVTPEPRHGRWGSVDRAEAGLVGELGSHGQPAELSHVALGVTCWPLSGGLSAVWGAG